MTKCIYLTRGRVAVIDDEDLPLVSQYKWQAITPDKDEKYFYAQGYLKGEGKRGKRIRMHRLILGAQEGVLVDHKDGDGLNNTRANLRLSTHVTNGQNRRPDKGKKFKGAFYNRTECKWESRIQVNKKRIRLGYFKSQEEALRAYDEAAKRFFGEFAWLNFP
jgi:hypothetical protein